MCKMSIRMCILRKMLMTSDIMPTRDAVYIKRIEKIFLGRRF